MALTEHEKAQIRHHLGYPEVSAVSIFQLGVPAAIEPSFMLEGAMDRIRPEAEDITRRKLAALDTIESQMIGDLELLATKRVEEIEINTDEMKALRTEYLYWRNSLANDLRCLPNPYDFRWQNAGGVNVNVQH